MDFPAHPGCRRCPLYEQARCIGMPTRLADNSFVKGEKALLIVGQAPGYQEDRTGRCFVGPTGKLLHALLDKAEIPNYADIYLTNACRCYPPGNDVTLGQVNACSIHLHEDIKALQAAYPFVMLLLTGAPAAKGVLAMSLTKAINSQGRTVVPHVPTRYAKGHTPPGPLPVYSTYHPMYLLRREPSKVYAVRDHLFLMRDHLEHPDEQHSPLPEAPPYTVAEAPPDPFPDLIALDIETYGALAGREQTVFHPEKSVAVDGCPREDLIQTAAVAWRSDEQEHVTVFNFQDPDHRAVLRQWLGSARTILGQNLVFDLSYLLFVDDELSQKLFHGSGIRLEDVILWNFLHSENRPERGLKPLAKLFALADYGSQPFESSGPTDPQLLTYNALDALVTLRARDLLLTAIARDYGPTSTKLSEVCRSHMSNLLWVALHMTLAGVAVDLPTLSRRNDRCLRAVGLIADKLKADPWYPVIVHGAGSRTSLQELVDLAAEDAHLTVPWDDRLLLTDKTKRISSKESNITLFLDTLPNDHSLVRPLRLLLKYREYAKLQNTYAGPILNDPIKGAVRSDGDVGLAYPTWYICPSKHDYSDEKEGGTVQGRITCKKPALQTAPKVIKRAVRSRFPGGTLWMADLSQIELRVAALLSGDPVMLQEYADRVDRHAATGSMIWDVIHASREGGLGGFWSLDKGDSIRKLFRQMGKTTNFLVVYEGQARKLHQTITTDIGKKLLAMGLPIPTEQDCQGIIDFHDSKYRRLREWQGELVEEAIARGFLELTTGWSRQYIGGRARIAGKDKSKVLDQPVQTIAAQLMQDAQAGILDRIRGTGILMGLQIYDSVFLDCPDGARDLGREILAETLPHPPLLSILEHELGRTVPLEYDIEEHSFGSAPEVAKAVKKEISDEP